ncbi:FAD-binding monooxygenase [Streptomyces tateyamensis]|uniref:FAD-binding monooxygenase n=1 Tax=Streptomyces tateyamensis TaxID=565073 RepID=A0A2V4N2N4_9ACTN|nr:FAD-dependent monooxygenase [Streptomyces tateyamensis]PYC78240.1 FAD-binding monooxygenase [Streptomyces tateyamensis]
MRITCVGGGPAGLYFAVLMKLRDPGHQVTVLERDAAGSTYGWGVTYWAGLLERCLAADRVSAQAIRASSVSWQQGVAHVGGEQVVRSSDEGFGIGRHRLLELLAARAQELGVRIEYRHEVRGREQLGPTDLVVAADGVNSVLRDARFGPTVTYGRNRYVWLGTPQVFTAFTFAFVKTSHGYLWCYGYPFDAGTSTCVIECAEATWHGLELDRLGEDELLARLGAMFAEALGGRPLLAGVGGARWQTFRTVTNQRWSDGKVVLLGDAAHTTHYSIGAGTSLALEDALALADALGRPGLALPEALAAYERERRQALLATQSAARYSARWYEELTRYLELKPEQFFALLGQRHSPLLPHVPPQLYYWANRAVEESPGLRRLRGQIGRRVARTLHRRG